MKFEADGHAPFVAQLPHDAGTHGLDGDVLDKGLVVFLHKNDEHHAD